MQIQSVHVAEIEDEESGNHQRSGIVYFIIQLHFEEYKQRPKRVQISRGICTPEDRLDRFPAVDQSVNWISRANSVPLRIRLSRIPRK